MKINLKVRAKNPLFWLQLALSVAMPIGAYFGITGADITSWTILGGVLIDAVSNPYVVFTAAISAYNALLDPTVRGLGDSPRVLGRDKPVEGAK